MQTQNAPIEITRRFNCVSTTSAAKQISSSEIAQQIAEFEKRGGIITPVAIGVSALSPGELFVSSDRESIATPRLSAAGKKAAQNKKHKAPSRAPKVKGMVILGDAAKILGVSHNTVGKWVEKGLLKIETQTGGNSRAKYVKESCVKELKKTLELNKKEAEKTLVNMNQAARLLEVNPATISKYIKNGTLKIEKINTVGKLTKLIKTADVLALKPLIKKGKN